MDNRLIELEKERRKAHPLEYNVYLYARRSPNSYPTEQRLNNFVMRQLIHHEPYKIIRSLTPFATAAYPLRPSMKKVEPPLTTAKAVADLGLWYANRPAGHQAAVNDEQEHDGMELEQCTSEQGAKGDALQDPALLQPVSHEGIQTQ